MAFVNDLLQKTVRYLRYYRKAVTRYNVHSPFMYAFFENVLDDRRHYPVFDEIEKLRSLALASSGYADVEDFGTGTSGRVMLRDLARRSASSPQKGRRLFRLVHWQQPRTILELGTSIGIGTAYLAAANTQAWVFSVEGSPELSAIARSHMQMLNFKHASIQTGHFDLALPNLMCEINPIDLVYIDGNHRSEPTLDYLEASLYYLAPDGLLVFDDIHWSADMEKAWAAIKEHPKVTLTIDCFDLGIVSASKRFREKQHFVAIPLIHKPWKIV